MEISTLGNGYEMYVGMTDTESFNHQADAFGSHRCFQRLRQLLRDREDAKIGRFGQIEEVAAMNLGDEQHMTRSARAGIEEGQVFSILPDHMSSDLAVGHPAEDAGAIMVRLSHRAAA